eukprot:TRINITY_DN4393_c0_g1_i1.p1 TRINITY_DN4393_c0_g1~~TRINITY_DN4393_c0_g1_i1.p1  ORF type:complete len:502 (+),score=49.85 TRINITY_DN4393_c0_g1_i1:45-1508(+)
MAGDLPDEKIEEAESFRTLIMLCLLFMGLFSSYLIRKYNIKFIHESAVTIFLGALLGLSVRFIPLLKNLKPTVAFNLNLFFLVLLPPIIFESGYTMAKRPFFKNILSILGFAIIGTTLSWLVFAILLYFVSNNFAFVSSLTLLECLVFGALISATDSVSVLVIFKELKVDSDLFSNVFGEGVLNDAVAIVIYKAVLTFDKTDLTPATLFLSLWEFCFIFIGSLAIGVVVGLFCSLTFKYFDFWKYPSLEMSIILVMSYATYMICEACGLSGIVSILFCGILMRHYVYQNVSSISQVISENLFEMISMISETFIFLYLGLSIFSFKQEYDLGLIISCLIICLVSRLANILPVSYFVNLVYKIRKQKRRIPWKHQFMLWFSGLRGAMSLALAVEIYDATRSTVTSGGLHRTPILENIRSGELILTSTLMIVIFTVIVLGSLAPFVVRILSIETSNDSEREEHSSWWSQIDSEYPFDFFLLFKTRFLTEK